MADDHLLHLIPGLHVRRSFVEKVSSQYGLRCDNGLLVCKPLKYGDVMVSDGLNRLLTI